MSIYVLVDSLHAGGPLRQTVVVQLDGVTDRAEGSVTDEGKTGRVRNNGLASDKSADSTKDCEDNDSGLYNILVWLVGRAPGQLCNLLVLMERDDIPAF